MNMPTPIPDYQTGKEIIARISPANPSGAAREIEAFLDALLAAPPEHDTFFRLLELLLQPATSVAEDLAKRYEDRPIPFGDLEETLFQESLSLRMKMTKAYALCVEGVSPKTPLRSERLAILLQRCIYFTGSTILEHFRARRQLPWGLWIALHGYYGTAEEMRVAEQPIPNVLSETRAEKTHCAETYLAFILCEMCGNYNLNLRDQKLARRWAFEWSARVALAPAHAGTPLPPFVIDLMQDAALRPSVQCANTDQVRCLDTSRLAAHINHLRQQLQRHERPSRLGLGDDCLAHECFRLLNHLVKRWTYALAARKFKRYAASGSLQVSTGFEEMHYFISGKEFQQPASVSVYSRNDFESVFSLRFQEDPVQTPSPRPKVAAYGSDEWEAVDQSANGFRLMRSLSGRQMAFGQLLALRSRDSDRSLLAQVVWLVQEDDKEDKEKCGLIIGIRTLPGLPTAIGVRSFAAAERHDAYQRGFLVSAPAPEHEQSLVLPKGMHQPGRIVDVFTDKPWQATMKEMIESGPDFERVKFDACRGKQAQPPA